MKTMVSAREPHLVSDQDHCHAVAGEPIEDSDNLTDQFGIERGGDLVEQD
jgi:hypothetical protein